MTKNRNSLISSWQKKKQSKMTIGPRRLVRSASMTSMPLNEGFSRLLRRMYWPRQHSTVACKCFWGSSDKKKRKRIQIQLGVRIQYMSREIIPIPQLVNSTNALHEVTQGVRSVQNINEVNPSTIRTYSTVARGATFWCLISGALNRLKRASWALLIGYKNKARKVWLGAF